LTKTLRLIADLMISNLMDMLPFLTTMNRDIGHQQKKYIDE